ncbi:lambda-exonuclease family protein [Photobacterium damselae]|uniref:lambda-exonuclease family protein n=1 Tax=Photobacterium damselae TaxID=38293 RepID=UPI001E445C3D|nr:YqaJ viral recombinase family protein [Photobacterium damselae]
MMKIINVQQGTQAWLDLRATKFTASEAPAMMGESKYQSRNDLLKQKATGQQPEINNYQESIFAKGHAAEKAARPLVEKLIGEELFPATGLSDEYDWMLASYDGITILEGIIFEHKLYNQELFTRVTNNDLEPHYYWQLEQQLLVSQAEKALFVCSDGTSELFALCEYISIPERRKKLIAGWLQFQKDLSSYTLTSEIEDIEAQPIHPLPALTYQMNGLTLHSNLDAFKQAASELVEKSKQPIETDQDFADAEALVKVFKGAEDKIKSLSERVLGEVKSIDTFVKDLQFISEQIRQARLATDKQVKNRKEEIRKNIINLANREIDKLSNELFQELHVVMPKPSISIIDALKGKKNITSLNSAANTAVSQICIELELSAAKVRENKALLDQYDNYHFLFNDWDLICFKANDDFKALVLSRIAIHKELEQKRLEEGFRIKATETKETQPLNSSFKLSTEATTALSRRLVSANNIASKILMVQLTAKEANYLRQRDAILTALENAGVNKWVGYNEAITALQSAQNIA